MAAVRDCAETMETQATSLRQALPAVPMPEELRAAVVELVAGLQDTSGRVTFELALLQAELAEDRLDVATAVKRLSATDAAMMTAVAALADVVDPLEKAAERDEQHERAFVLVIEATGVMLQAIEKAKAATQALGATVPQTPRRVPAPPVRVAADGSVVVLQAGAEGGDVTLIGRTTDAGTWAFARVTDDQTEALFGESGVELEAPPPLKPDDWVESWDDALRLMDRYRWARLHPLAVHPDVRRAGAGGGGGAAGERGVDIAERGAGEVGAVVQDEAGASRANMNDDHRDAGTRGFSTGVRRRGCGRASRRPSDEDGKPIAEQIEADACLRARADDGEATPQGAGGGVSQSPGSRRRCMSNSAQRGLDRERGESRTARGEPYGPQDHRGWSGGAPGGVPVREEDGRAGRRHLRTMGEAEKPTAVCAALSGSRDPARVVSDRVRGQVLPIRQPEVCRAAAGGGDSRVAVLPGRTGDQRARPRVGLQLRLPGGVRCITRRDAADGVEQT